MTVYDTLASLWRTVVPMIVGALVAALAHAGIGIDSAAATMWLGSAFSAAYYALFRVLEAHVSARWGWLLGLARPPQYPAGKSTAATVVPPSVTPGA
ncbi:hypothetical protein [Streptomyces sp. NRRL F-5123]|uniref:hypothetical protein n=1 Tax=Streptomyces sp. NRRL F-5123 TaxID=1463856 RepID=UPI0004E2544F|nr:hypothetical protein [Streptomyces sp. NRRL F-5123]